jgi:hypothetical protein
LANANGKIFIDRSVDPPIGIDPWADVAYVTGRSTGDYGQLCGDVDENGADVNKVNVHSVHKPVRSALLGGTEQEVKVPAKYGFRVDTKPAGSGTLSFIQQMRSQGANYAHWGWYKPRGEGRSPKEHYRIVDFEGYRHGQLPYRTPAFLTRLASSPISINGGQPLSVEVARRSTSTEVLTSTSFVLNDAYDVTVLVTIEDPNPESAASYMNWDVDGDFQISLIDSRGRVVDSDYQTGFGIRTGNLPQVISLHFEGWHSLEGYEGPFRIQYRLHMANDTYYNDGSNDVYIPVTLKIDTVYAATLTMSKTGQDGVVVRPAGMEAEWRENGYRAREAVFGANASWPIVVVEVCDGSTTQRKICLVPNSGFIPFQRIGITIRPRQAADAKDVIVYLFYGNYSRIFPDFQRQVDYGDLSLADAQVLTCAPNCYNELGIIPQDPEPFMFYQEDCQGARFDYNNGTYQEHLDPQANGFTSRENLVSRFRLAWDFSADNIPVAMEIVFHLDIYNIDEELLQSDEKAVQVSAVSHWYGSVLFDVDLRTESLAPFEMYARMWADVGGDIYYIRFYPQAVSTTLTAVYPLGWQDEP